MADANVMDGAGFHNEHSVQQQEAAAAGTAMLARAARDVPLAGNDPIVIADFGAAEGRNSLVPLRAALDALGTRKDAHGRACSVVHTDLPENDFSSLFGSVSDNERTYARAGVYTYAAGRSFYERLFPDATVVLGWSSTAVVWLHETPCVLADHLFSYAADGPPRATWAAAAAADWKRFLRLRSSELRSGGEMVVTTLVSGPDYLPWIHLIEAGARDACDAGVLSPAELEAMVLPTYIREPEELFGAVRSTDLPLMLVEEAIRPTADPAFAAFTEHRDPGRYSREATAAYRAWSEPALRRGLGQDRTAGERDAAMDTLYEHTRRRLEASPTACVWQIGIARIRRADR